MTKKNETELHETDLRDYFAAQALQGLIANAAYSPEQRKPESFAAMAYAYADALLKAKRNGNKQTAKEADRNPRNSAKADPISTYVRSLVPK